ncbi:TBC1 domain family member 16 isoform X1 [Hemiscyllium ocellatum]|uniref:TBC1 domain family member 16 isoform X1 n=2 Tax=Hemiscyllium ocellatum TaxID=170820 RepID=UPI002965E757|nr:TBC1 domain family member 16 isoform X1 [Hemiscyllium ocellatum]XP_060700484.1 TBC1 domain family member 16 isoform X1 [Hemiscyllium ocellatum]XP_060700485.1 TBC1 domain family member 16 isoform X1 [Hemiscyllium ocellatum]XP_060700486.1 TBC1 domain family member 16 isoform X1 [Hemiscyllium ocellatum]
MSLGQLLRRASSKASDLLTFNQSSGSSRILDGEIIYSKNNVCVHPSDVLRGLGEHHPGYLCIHLEKDELLGTTLIITWIPNTRIQRQDEEALRYITPESSPVRKVQRRRCRHTHAAVAHQSASTSGKTRESVPLQDDEIITVSESMINTMHIGSPRSEQSRPLDSLALQISHSTLQQAHSDPQISSTITGHDNQKELEMCAGGQDGMSSRREQGEDETSYDLTTDDVSRDSTIGSDSDTFSSPLCLSPVGDPLAESSRSVFLDAENREMCEEHMANLASSISDHSSDAQYTLQFSENYTQSNSTKWEEQQKVLALEQLYGVFRVDLGQMRSLRLFFSDEACTSGQLVIASRESQYKIFHFHHGGLDKLSEVFQQWKYCTETHQKDQVSDVKACMQFSIKRPNLPSSEIHPEENMYKRLDVTTWLNHLNDAGQVEEEYKLRKAIFFGGIDPTIRGEVWPFLLRFYSYESTSEERESLRIQKRTEYEEIQRKRLSMTSEEQEEFWRKIQFTVDKDVVRTDRSKQFFKGENNPNVEAMRNILLNYAVYNPEIGYSQGMSDLVAPILSEVRDESDTFWCFVGLMQNTIFISSPRDDDMERQLLYLRELLRLMHPRFYQHLVSLGEDGLQMLFCHRWILLCFKREFPEAEALRIWEACWAHYQTDYFHLFVCVAIVVIYGDDVIEQQLATDQMLLHFSNLAMHMSGEIVLRKARSLLYQFRLLPRIPCSLHDLCKLCGTGMWDSGYIPAVECTLNHLDFDGCPYGGTSATPSPKSVQEGKRGAKDVFTFLR